MFTIHGKKKFELLNFLVFFFSGKNTVSIYEVNRPQLWTRSLYTSRRCYNAEEQETEVDEDYHSIIKDTERSKGESRKIKIL
jgi:hypothetical protein